jgi:hypothetical protein
MIHGAAASGIPDSVWPAGQTSFPGVAVDATMNIRSR